MQGKDFEVGAEVKGNSRNEFEINNMRELNYYISSPPILNIKPNLAQKYIE